MSHLSSSEWLHMFGSLQNIAKFLSISTLLVLIDQLTKWLAQTRFAESEFIPVTSFFNLGLTYNTGAAFGFLANQSGWQRWALSLIALAAVIVIVGLMLKHHREKHFSYGLAFILAGALGNLIDRIQLGKVVDFLDFYYINYHWPAFNFADVFIFIGVLIVLFFSEKAVKN